MRRREFIYLFSTAVLGWPGFATAQQTAMPIVAFLGSTRPDRYKGAVAMIQTAIIGAGHAEGKDVVFEHHWANDEPERLPELAAGLVQRNVAVIVTTGGNRPVQAAKAASSKIPIVFATGADPVQTGLVSSLRASGTNVTGVTFYSSSLAPKRLEFMRALLPQATTFGILMHKETSLLEHRKELETSAAKAGMQFVVVITEDRADLEGSVGELIQKGTQAILIDNHAHFVSRIAEIIEVANRRRLPAMYYDRSTVQSGGLIAYGPKLEDVGNMLRQAGRHVAGILRGEKPGNLPIHQPTRFELAINLRTARELGIPVPPVLVAQADEIIE